MPARDAQSAETDPSTSERILSATAEVLGRNGMNKLSLSEVALQAGVSRPTLYRWFASKEDLLDAFVAWERNNFDNGLRSATTGLRGTERLDAALQFIVDYQRFYSGVRMVDIEPHYVINRMSTLIPVMSARLERLITGPRASVAAATAVRVAVSHYVVRSEDRDQFLEQLRHAVGIKPR